MKKYRIMYNGLNYRVQWLGKTFILRWPKWYWLRRFSPSAGDFIADFPSQEKARDAIIQSKIKDYARKRGYKSIQEFTNENPKISS